MLKSVRSIEWVYIYIFFANSIITYQVENIFLNVSVEYIDFIFTNFIFDVFFRFFLASHLNLQNNASSILMH